MTIDDDGRPGAPASLWLATAPPHEPRPALAGSGGHADVVVLGAGVAGLTTGYLLARAGVDVVLLEATEVGAGATGHTTAKVTAAHGLCYDDLRSRHDRDTASAYAALNTRAIRQIEEIAAREGIDCGWRRRDAYTYTQDPSRAADLAAEAEAAREAGLDAHFVAETPLPFDIAGAVLVRDQAEFHPVEWLLGLLAATERAGARVHEHSRVVEVSAGDPCRVRTAEAELTADRVIVATHHPTLDRGLFFARLHQERSYCLAVDAADPPAGMFLSVDQPTRSLRTHRRREDGRELLLVGGEGHKVGQEDHAAGRFAALDAWAHDHFAVRSVEQRWSAQDPIPPDGLPFVGRLVPHSDRLLVATGFRKWGMTNGTAAASVLADRILGRENEAGRSWSTTRIDPIAAGPSLVRENADVARRFVLDRLAKARPAHELRPGEGAIVTTAEGERAAGHRDADGELHLFGATCTHLGCEVRFNDAEASWDCPCHGSRFDAVDGRVLEGPAVHPLPSRALAPEPQG